MKIRKMLLSIMLSISMTVTMFPYSVFAVGEEPAANAGAGADVTQQEQADETPSVDGEVPADPSDSVSEDDPSNEDDSAEATDGGAEKEEPAETGEVAEEPSEEKGGEAAQPAEETEETAEPEEVEETEEEEEPEEAELPESSADYIANDDVEAIDVQGKAALDKSVAQDVLKEETDLSNKEIKRIVRELFSVGNSALSKKNTSGPVEVDGYPRQGDGSNIESIEAKWITEDSDPDNGDDSLLYVKPVDDTEQSVRLQINYALSGEHNYDPGDVTITVPAYIFKTRNGKNTGPMIIPFPEEPSKQGDFNWKLVGDTYVLTNTVAMSAATKGYMQFAFTELVPHEIVDMQETGIFNATIEVVTHRDNVIALRSNDLTAQIDTEAKVTRANKRVSGKAHFVEASEIPESQRIEGEEEYVLVEWYAWAHIKANTEYYLDIKDTIPDEYDGFIIGATSEDGRTLVDSKVYTGHYDGQTKYYHYKTAYPASQFKPDEKYEFHNNVEFTVTEVDDPKKDPITINPNVGDDPQLVTMEPAEAKTPFSFSDPKWELPPGHFMVVKNGNDDKPGSNKTHHKSYKSSYSDLHLWSWSPYGWYGIYPSGLNDLQDEFKKSGENGKIRLSYTIDSIGYVMPWMFDDPGAWEISNEYTRRTTHYTRPVTMITVDTGFSFGRNDAKLKVGEDYDFVSVEFPAEPWLYTGVPNNINPDGTWAAIHAEDGTFLYTRDNNKTHWPDIILEIQRNGTWEKWATASWKSGSFKAIMENGSTSTDRVIDVPKDTENFRTIVTLQSDPEDPAVKDDNKCLQAAIDYDIRPVIELKSTEKMMKLIDKAFQDSHVPTMNVWNGVNMKSYSSDYAGANDKTQLVDLYMDGYDIMQGYTTDTSIYPHKTAKQEITDVDYETRQIKIHYSADVEERTFINDKKTYEQAIADGRVQHETHGYWRDLLPKGVSVDKSTITVRDGDSIKSVQTIENYRKSGRTMLIVEVDLKPQPKKYKDGQLEYYEDVPSISFDATYDFEAYKDYGDEIHNVIAFESSNDSVGTIKNYTGEPDDPYAENNAATKKAFINDAERDLMKDIDPNKDTPSFVYAGVNTKIDIIAAARTSLTKDVMVNNDGYWSEGTYYTDIYGEPPVEAPEGRKRTVYVGGQYAYRLRMMSDTDTISKDLVIYDSLENFYARNNAIDSGLSGNDDVDVDAPRWQGTLRSVDVSHLEKIGCAPVVYYSTVENLQLSDETDPRKANKTNMNLENSSIWIKASDYKGSLDDVKAIAIDARKQPNGEDFVLNPLDSATIIVNMHAPSGEEADGYIAQKDKWGNSAHAYNNAYLTCESIDVNSGQSDAENFVRKDYTKIGLEQFELPVTKTWDDDDNRDGIRPESATFHLLANGKPAKEVLGDYVTDTITLPRKDVEEGEDPWTGVFDHIMYTDDNGEKISYDIVEDDAEGYSSTLTIKGNEYYFKNTHKPATTTVSGEKKWTGDNKELRPEYIIVELYANDEYLKKQTVYPDTNGNWKYSFEDLYKYEDGKEIKYTVKEILKGKGESYEPEIEEYDINNTYHPYGDLVVSKEVTDVTEVSKDTIFPFTFSFTVKEDEGEEAESVPVTKKFDYKILEGEDNEISSGQVGDGDTLEIKGGQRIEVYEIDEYVNYKVTEGDLPGFTRSSVSGDEGVIKPNQTSEADFVNKYSATGRVDLGAKKTLLNRELKQYQFKYELYQVEKGEDETETETLVRTASNNRPAEVKERDDGTIEYSVATVDFGALKYTQEDAGKTFMYRMKEVDSGKPGFEYDKAIYEVEVTVTDNGDGTLTCDKKYLKGGEDFPGVPEFENQYKASGKISLRAWKDLPGRKLKDGEFSFELLGEDGKTVIAERTNTADGSILFDADTIEQLQFDEKDIGKKVHFFVREKAGNDATVTYDDSVFAYEITVVDNEDGTLSFAQGHQTVGLEPIDGTAASIDQISITLYYNHDGYHSPNHHDYPDKSWNSQYLNYRDTLANDRAIRNWSRTTTSSSAAARRVYRTDDAKQFFDAVWDDPGRYITKKENVGDPESFRAEYGATQIDNHTVLMKYTVSGYYNGPYSDVESRYLYIYRINPDNRYVVTGETEELPVFTNKLKPGNLSVTKRTTESENADPNQEFRFKVRLIGDQIKDGELNYTISKAAAKNDTSDASGTDAGKKAAKSASKPKASASALKGASRSGGTTTGTDIEAIDVSGYPAADATVQRKGTSGSCTYEIYTDGTLVLRPTDGSSGTLANYQYLSYVPWHSSSVKHIVVREGVKTGTSMYCLFAYLSNVETMDLHNLDTSNATRMDSTFSNNPNLKAVDLRGFDTSKVTTFELAFAGSGMENLDLSGFDTSKATNMQAMFAHCKNLKNLDITSFNTSKVNNMSAMFSNCTSLKRLELNNFDTGSLTSQYWGTSYGSLGEMYGMFYYCSSLEYLDISSFDTSKVTDMGSFLSGDKTLKTVVLGDDFTFGKGERKAILPTPDEGVYTGKWIRVDDPDNGYTPEELRDSYSSAMAGTWIWEKIEGIYAITYSASNASGSMPVDRIKSEDDFTLPACAFVRPGYRFVNWVDQDGKVYENKAEIPGGTVENGTKISLTAVFEKVNTTVEMKDGEIEFTLLADETATFSDLPAGTAYQVWEETPDGWVLVEQSGTSGTIPPADTAQADFTNKYQPGVATAQFNGTKLLDNTAVAAGAFQFRLLEDGKVLQTKPTLDGGFIQFDTIEYTEEDIGVHHYEIEEIDPNIDTIDYDTHKDKVTVTVSKNTDGILSAAVDYDRDGIRFVNKTRPGMLKITKNAETTDANKDTVFKFRVRFTNESGKPLGNDINWYLEDKDGKPVSKTRSLLSKIKNKLTGGTDKAGNNLSALLDDVKESFTEPLVLKANAATGGTYDGVDWQITDNWELIIGKQGETQIMTKRNSRSSSSWPWQPYRDKITKVRFAGPVEANGSLDSMFYAFSALTSIDFSNFNTTGATNLDSFMSGRVSKLTSLDVSMFDTSNVTSMGGSFAYMQALTKLDLSNFDTSKVTRMDYLFWGDKRLSEINVTGWNTSNVTNMNCMFGGYNGENTVVRSLDLSSFDTRNVKNMKQIFYDLRNLETLDISNFDTRNVTNMQDMFAQSKKLKSVKLGEYFEFKNNSILPDASSSSPYTGEWMRIEDEDGRFSPQELKEQYNSALAGTWVWAINSYRGVVQFDANGGYTSATPIVASSSYQSIRMPTSSNTSRPNYTLAGWNTEPDGSGKQYNAGSSYSDVVKLGKYVVLYAMWKGSDDRYYKVEHYQQRASLDGYSLVTRETKFGEKGSEVTPKVNTYTGFKSPESQTVTIADDDSTVVKYYYDRIVYDVIFDGNGATSGQMRTVKMLNGISAKLPANIFQKDGSIFTGWNTKPDGSGTSYTNEQIVRNISDDETPVTLYAIWMDNPNETLTPTDGEIEVSCKPGETIVIPNLPAGTKYTVEEIDIPDGWTKTGEVGTEGEILACRTSNASVTNKYSAKGQAKFEAHKLHEGHNLTGGEFKFELLDSKGEVLQTKTNDPTDNNKTISVEDEEGNVTEKPNDWAGTAPVSFDAIEYNESDIGKTYTYKIREVKGNDTVVSYDPHEETVTVKITDAGNGLLNAEVQYDSDGAYYLNTDKDTSLKITKKILGDTEKYGDVDFSFKVVLKDTKGEELKGKYPVVRIAGGKEEEDGTISSGDSLKLNADETVRIDKIPDGTSYEVTEVQKAGWDQVKSESEKGTVHADTVSEAVFTNEYSAEGELELSASKMLENRKLEAEQFTFALYDRDNDGELVYTAVNDADGKVTFPKLHYSEEDAGKTFHYTVAEIIEEGGAVDYDQSRYDVDVTVTDNGDGTLKVEASENAKSMTFTNTFNAKGSIDVKGTKSVKNGSIDQGPFTFSIFEKSEFDKAVKASGRNGLKETDGLKLVAKATTADLAADENGSVSFDFGKIDFELLDILEKNGGSKNADGLLTKTYEYVVVEDIPAEAVKTTYDGKEVYRDKKTGIVYDPEVHNLTITVTETEGNTLDVKAKGGDNEFVFTNTYTSIGNTTIDGIKHIENRSFKSGDKWTFSISGASAADNSKAAPMPKDKNGKEVTKVTIEPKSGKAEAFTFGKINYTLKDVGKWVYTVKESGTVAGVKNDSGTHTVTVTVKDNGNGTLSIVKDYGQGLSKLEFTNTYTAEKKPSDCEILISKVNQDGKKISGAVFEIYKIDGDTEEQLTQDDYSWLDEDDQFVVGKSAFRITGLEDGRYQIREVLPPEDYEIYNKKPIAFSIIDGALDSDLNVITSNVEYKKLSDKKHQFTVTNNLASIKKKVKTGDDTHVLLYSATLLGAILAFLLMLIYRRKRKA